MRLLARAVLIALIAVGCGGYNALVEHRVTVHDPAALGEQPTYHLAPMRCEQTLDGHKSPCPEEVRSALALHIEQALSSRGYERVDVPRADTQSLFADVSLKKQNAAHSGTVKLTSSSGDSPIWTGQHNTDGGTASGTPLDDARYAINIIFHAYDAHLEKKKSP